MLLDVYALAMSRDASPVAVFLNTFLLLRERCGGDYTVQHSDSVHEIVFSTPEEAIAYCCEHTTTCLSLYWSRIGSEGPHFIHVHFLEDGGLVFGLSIPYECSGEAPVAWHPLFDELMNFTGADNGYCVAECPPAGTTDEFRQISKAYREAA